MGWDATADAEVGETEAMLEGGPGGLELHDAAETGRVRGGTI